MAYVVVLQNTGTKKTTESMYFTRSAQGTIHKSIKSGRPESDKLTWAALLPENPIQEILKINLQTQPLKALRESKAEDAEEHQNQVPHPKSNISRKHQRERPNPRVLPKLQE